MPAQPQPPSITINGILLPVDIRINRRARRLILRVDTLGPRIKLTCPSKRSVKDGLRFVETRRAWIADRLNESPPAVPFCDGGRFPLRGETLTIRHVPAQRRAVERHGQELLVGGEAKFLPRRVEDWLKKQAREEFCVLADRFCEELGVSRRRISVRDTRSRWGSCSSQGSISLSWRLILAPPEVYSYVVAHEVAHLKHLDHSPAFWAVVDRLVTVRPAAQAWLKDFGAGLYGIGARGADMPDSKAA